MKLIDLGILYMGSVSFKEKHEKGHFGNVGSIYSEKQEFGILYWVWDESVPTI